MKKNSIKKLTLMLAFLGLSAPVYALQFSNIFSFGDSLSDVGYAPDAPVSNGRNLWTADLAAKLGINYQSYNTTTQTGNDYAYSGDQTGPDFFDLSTNPEGGVAYRQIGIDPNDPRAKDSFLKKNPRIDSKALYTYWAGNDDFIGNKLLFLDILTNSSWTIEEKLEQLEWATTGIIKNGVNYTTLGLNALHNAGGKYFLVVNLPNFGKLPLLLDPNSIFHTVYEEFPIISEAFTAASVEYNMALNQRLNSLPYDVIQVDIFSIMNSILANPARYGFTNTTYAASTHPEIDPNTSLFWDVIHPTNYGHKGIFDAIWVYFEAPTYASLLSRVPTGNLDTVNTTVGNLLTNLRAEENKIEKEWRVFASGSYSSQNPGEINGTASPSYRTNSKNLTVGAHYRYNENLLLGAAFSPSSTKMNAEKYSFHLNEYIFSGFGEYKQGPAYINSILSFGLPSYTNIQRSQNILKAVDFTNPANTSGYHFGGAVNLGYKLFENEKISTGPIANLSYQHVNIKGYNESGVANATTDGTTFNYFKQTYKTLTSGIGWELTHKHKHQYGTLITTANAQYKTQHLNQDRDMRFETATLGGSHGAVPVTAPKGSYGALEVGVSNMFKNSVSVGLSVSANVGNRDFAQQIYMISASMPF